MKKTLSVILAVILMFSAVSTMAFAEDATEPAVNMVTVKFFWSEDELKAGEAKNTIEIEAGQSLVKWYGWYDCKPATPVKEATDTTKYTFDGWELYTLGEDGNWIATGVKNYTETIPDIPADAADGTEICYVATFYEKEIPESTTLWALIASIFARFNVIFEYFAKIFEGVF